MASVLHFMPEGAERAACGAQIFLCDEATDNPRNVGCGRCKRTKAFKNYDPTRYNVDVWTFEGDVIRSEHRVTADAVERIRHEYENDVALAVVVAEEC